MQGKPNQATAFRDAFEDMKKQEITLANHSKCTVCCANWACRRMCDGCESGDGHCCPAEFTCPKYN